jgi:hypothetical protein
MLNARISQFRKAKAATPEVSPHSELGKASSSGTSMPSMFSDWPQPPTSENAFAASMDSAPVASHRTQRIAVYNGGELGWIKGEDWCWLSHTISNTIVEVGPPGLKISRAILNNTVSDQVSKFDLISYIPGTVTMVITEVAIASEA